MEDFSYYVNDSKDCTLSICLKKLELVDVPQLFRTVDENRAYLRTWLPWLDDNTVEEDSAKFIKKTQDDYQNGVAIQFGIWHEDRIIGVIGLNEIHKENLKDQYADFGYWLAENMQGKGIISRAIKMLVPKFFEKYSLHYVTIKVAEQNYKSRAVAERLGFEYREIRKNQENLYGKQVDHVVYVLRKE